MRFAEFAGLARMACHEVSHRPFLPLTLDQLWRISGWHVVGKELGMWISNQHIRNGLDRAWSKHGDTRPRPDSGQRVLTSRKQRHNPNGDDKLVGVKLAKIVELSVERQ